MPWMSKPQVPEVRLRGRTESELRRQTQGVEVACAFTLERHLAGWNILYREAMRIKFNGYIVISSKLTNRDQILDKVIRNKNIIQEKGRGICRNGGGG
jgi:hypothetical protein